MLLVAVCELREGDLVDLQNDPFADPKGEHIQFQSELAEVSDVEQEIDACTRIGFEGFDLVGFPPQHLLKVAERSLPATAIALPREFDRDRCELAISLACYCSDEDTALSRREFLIYVRDRIDMDLQTGDH